MEDTYAILGLARPRSAWFSNVSAWTTSGAIPASFSKCLSAAETHQRLSSLQPWSVLIIDAELISANPDLVKLANNVGVPVFAVGNTSFTQQLSSDLVLTAVLSPALSPAQLLAGLTAHAAILPAGIDNSATAEVADDLAAWSGSLIAVCGPGGTGSSTSAMAIAQGFGRRELDEGLVVLADFARNSELAMLHDACKVSPSVEDLAEQVRTTKPRSDEVRALTFADAKRGYSLLLGARKQSAWAALPPSVVEDAIKALRRSFRYVITDITGDFEGVATSGSHDVEERNGLARQSVSNADVIVVVSGGGMKGVYSLARICRELIELAIEPKRILPIISSAAKSPLAKRDEAKAFASLVHSKNTPVELASHVFLPRKKIERQLQDGDLLPESVVDPLYNAVAAMLERVNPLLSSEPHPEAILPGELGSLGVTG